jgi:glutathione S-transferase
MHELGIPFTETVIALDRPKTARQIARHSGAGRLPVLHHGKITVWESLAILEYLAERSARAMARAVANEMHAGFAALRNALPMNLRRPRKPLAQAMGEDVRRNVSRIETLWSQCRNAHGRGGPFLFGKFGIADAMYAPVVTRFDTYAVKVGRDARAYMDAILATKGIQAWKSDAIKEQWVIAADEVD